MVALDDELSTINVVVNGWLMASTSSPKGVGHCRGTTPEPTRFSLFRTSAKRSAPESVLALTVVPSLGHNILLTSHFLASLTELTAADRMQTNFWTVCWQSRAEVDPQIGA